MLIERFEVEGYKNFRAPVALAGPNGSALGAYNVILGENNIGKSNLLEALALGLRLLAMPEVQAGLRTSEFVAVPNGLLPWHDDGRPHELFTLGGPPIARFSYVLRLTPAELRAAGVERDGVGERIVVAVTLRLNGERREANAVLHGVSGDNSRAETLHDSHPAVTALRCAVWRPRAGGGTPRALNTLALLWEGAALPLDRHPEPSVAPRPRRTSRGLVGQSLQDALWDLANSEAAPSITRWEAFQALASRFLGATYHRSAHPPAGRSLGAGGVGLLYDRSQQRATLVAEVDGQRVPAHLLGNGPQQVLGLLANLLVTGADVILIEEPEIHLLKRHQGQLRLLLEEVLRVPGGPQQLFLTTHSAEFAASDAAARHWLHATEDGPQVRPLAPGDVHLHTGDAPITGTSDATMQAVIDERGAVRLPRSTVENLGGVLSGLVFQDGPARGQTTVWSVDAWLAARGLDDEAPAAPEDGRPDAE